MATEDRKIVQPIRRAFPAEKAKAWHYKIHPYYTKQPSNVVGEYIRHFCPKDGLVVDRKSTRLNSSHGYISYAVFCLHNVNTAKHDFMRGAAPRAVSGLTAPTDA